MSDDINITTADMLEIYASGGNGAEYVDGPALLLKAAQELRETQLWLDRTGKAYDDVVKAIPDEFILDPPDGGDVKPAEAIQRMVAKIAKLQAGLNATAEVVNSKDRDCAQLRAELARLRPLERP